MYEKAKKTLYSLIEKADGNWVSIIGSDLCYLVDGVSQSNKEFDWFNFFDDIMEDSDFFSDPENMQLFITFAQKIKAP